MNRTPILNMWLLVLGKAIENRCITNGRHFSNFARTLIIFWIFLWFTIRSFYEGALYNEIQSKKIESQFDTVEKVRASQCEIILVPSIYPAVRKLIEPDR